jgi:hypothetical protein
MIGEEVGGIPWHQCMKQELHLVVEQWEILSMSWEDMMVHFG